MHIKYLELENFKSYREKIHIKAFSDGHNTVIGRNGSGKSNLFRAIQFVLCEKEYTNLGQKERKALLNEGLGMDSAAEVAYVEICFDNSDGRFKIEAKTVVIRRTIGEKKDHCSINGKTMSQKDVIDYLETAGFSRTNPYYIVQQGKVNDLCLKKDKDRLDLLRKLAGTSLFEKKKSDALKALEEEKSYESKVQLELDTLTTKVAKLESEQSVVSQWRSKRDEKDAIQAIISEKERSKSSAKIDNYESTLLNLEAEALEKRKQINLNHTTAEQLLLDMENLNAKLLTLKREKESVDNQVTEERSLKTDLEIQIRDDTEQGNLDNEHQTLLEHDIKRVRTELEQKKQRLQDEVLPRKLKQDQEISDLNESLSLTKDELATLKARDTSEFESIEARDSFLKREVKLLNRKASQIAATIKQQDIDLEALKGEQAKERKHKNSLNKKKAALERDLDNFAGEESKLNKGLKGFIGNRRTLWRTQKELSRAKQEVRQGLSKTEKKLKRSVGIRKYEAIQDVLQIAHDLSLQDSVYGPVYNLLAPVDDSKELALALDLTAGDQLNHIVCDNDQTCAELVEEMKKRGTGRCTLKPLSHVTGMFRDKPDDLCDIKDYTISEDGDSSPMGTHVNISESKFKPIVRKIYGKTLLCDENAIATVHERYNATCVTLTGQMLESNGMFRGGFVDHSRTRLTALKNYNSCLKKSQEVGNSIITNDENIDRIGQQINKQQSLLQEVAAKKQRAEILSKQLSTEISEVTKALNRIDSQIRTTSELKLRHEEDQSQIESSVALLQQQMQQQLKKPLSKKEQERINMLKAEQSELDARLGSARVIQMDLNNEVKLLELDLEENLIPRIAKMTGKLETLRNNTREPHASSPVSEELKSCDDRITALLTRQAEYDNDIEKKNQDKEDLQQNISMKQADLKQMTEDLASCERDIERYMNKVELETEKLAHQEEAQKEMKHHAVSSQLRAKLKNRSIASLWERVKRVNKELQQFGNVNELAIEQFKTFSEEKKKYEKKKKELEDTSTDVLSLLEKLENQKEAAVASTIDKVKKHFRQVFKELVPKGTGRLVLIEEEDMVVGISPRISFDSSADKQNFRSMSQLSGGQKALVALCFIFAIQRCDPAPFYLFDEIDQALDEKNRVAVANMIQKQNQEHRTQFITTTFRPELVEVADKVLAVSNENKISDVHDLSKEEALEFIRSIGEEEAEQIQETTLRAQKSLEVAVH